MLSTKSFQQLRNCLKHQRRNYTGRKLKNSEIREKRNALFEKEKARQLSLVTRDEKIQVSYNGTPEPCNLGMNKGLSTPFNCAMHIQGLTMQRSALALVNGEPWDMHRPLVQDSEIKFLHFKEKDPKLVNEAFWRTCSFFLGYILERAFKDDYYVELCSFPTPNIKSDSFVYDVDLDLPDWNPASAELNCLSRLGGQIGNTDMKLERLDVDAAVAQEMFEDNRFKCSQIPYIASQSDCGSRVTLYRMKDHVDIIRGPLLGSSSQVCHFKVTAVHDIVSPDFGALKRVQGMAIPTQLSMHCFPFDMMCERAAQLNPALVPTFHSLHQLAQAKST